jgi:hypothetical protein
MNQENRKAGKLKFGWIKLDDVSYFSWFPGFQIESLSSFPAFLIQNPI